MVQVRGGHRRHRLLRERRVGLSEALARLCERLLGEGDQDEEDESLVRALMLAADEDELLRNHHPPPAGGYSPGMLCALRGLYRGRGVHDKKKDDKLREEIERRRREAEARGRR